jgi:hypothetical protein
MVIRKGAVLIPEMDKLTAWAHDQKQPTHLFLNQAKILVKTFSLFDMT